MAILLTFYAALAIDTGVMIDFGLGDLGMGIFLCIISFTIMSLVIQLGGKKLRADRKEKADQARKASHIEDATGFSEDKFKTTFDTILFSAVPASHALVFYYTSLHGARKALKSGIPAHAAFDGVVVSFRLPSDLTEKDVFVFTIGGAFPPYEKSLRVRPFEAVLAMSLPKRLLFPLPGHEDDISLRLIPSVILKAMRPSSFSRVLEPVPWVDGLLLLPPGSALRSYQLVPNSAIADGPGPNAQFMKKEGKLEHAMHEAEKKLLAGAHRLLEEAKKDMRVSVHARRHNLSIDGNNTLPEGHYEIEITEAKLGFGLDRPNNSNKKDLPVVTAAPEGKSKPAAGDRIVSVAGTSLAGSKDARATAIKLMQSSGRPLKIVLMDSAHSVSNETPDFAECGGKLADVNEGGFSSRGRDSLGTGGQSTLTQKFSVVGGEPFCIGSVDYEEPVWDYEMDDPGGVAYPDLEALQNQQAGGLERFRKAVKRVIMMNRLGLMKKNMEEKKKIKRKLSMTQRLSAVFLHKEDNLTGTGPTAGALGEIDSFGLEVPKTVTDFTQR